MWLSLTMHKIQVLVIYSNASLLPVTSERCVKSKIFVYWARALGLSQTLLTRSDTTKITLGMIRVYTVCLKCWHLRVKRNSTCLSSGLFPTLSTHRDNWPTCAVFFMCLVLQPFQDYFTYFYMIVNQRLAKIGIPGEKPPDLPLQSNQWCQCFDLYTRSSQSRFEFTGRKWTMDMIFNNAYLPSTSLLVRIVSLYTFQLSGVHSVPLIHVTST